MSTFNVIGVAGTGVTVYRKWLDAVADNISNMNDVTRTSQKAYQARYVLAQEAADGNGAQVGGVALGSPAGVLAYEPDSPLADTQGYIRRPDIDLGAQMGQMIMAERAYQANISLVDRARDAYNAAIQLGK